MLENRRIACYVEVGEPSEGTAFFQPRARNRGRSMGQSAWSRRRFMAQAAVTGSALSIGLARSGDVRAAAGPEGPYFGVHTHIGRTWNGGPPLTPDALLKWMDAHHVARAVVLPLVSPESSPQTGPGRAPVRAPGRLRPAPAGTGEDRTHERSEITWIDAVTTLACAIILEDASRPWPRLPRPRSGSVIV